MYSGGVSSRFHPGFAAVKKPKRRLTTAPPPPPKFIPPKPDSLGVRIRLNVSGRVFEAYSYIFDVFPQTLLGDPSRRSRFYDAARDEYFFDRNREAFEGVLQFYLTRGAFEVPLFVPIEIFYEELLYFDLVNYLDSTANYSDEDLLICALKNQLIALNKQYANSHESPELEKEFNMKKKKLKEKFAHLKCYFGGYDGIDGEDEEELAKKAPKNRAQRFLWLLLERPNRSLLGRVIAFICLVTVILSVTIMCLETAFGDAPKTPPPTPATPTKVKIHTAADKRVHISVGSGSNPNLYDQPPTYEYEEEEQSVEDTLEEAERRIEFLVLEIFCNTIFTIEIILRFIAAPSKLAFIRSFPNTLDVVAVLPFWTNMIITQLAKNSSSSSTHQDDQQISPTTTLPSTTIKLINQTLQNLTELAVNSTTSSMAANKARKPNQYGLSVLRILRLTRVLRILKLSRHIRTLNIMGKILYQCIYEIILLLTFLTINIVIFSSLMYIIELQVLGEKSPFLSIPHSFWWAVISFTTIGYGDLLPHSDIGKLFGSFFILCGILIALLPVPILSCKFERIYKDLTAKHLTADDSED